MPSHYTVAPAHSSTITHTTHYYVPTEIVQIIIHLLRKEKLVLARCSVVSRLFQDIAEPLLYKEIAGILSLRKRDASARLFVTLAASPSRSSYVERLTLVIANEGPLFNYFNMPSLTLRNLTTLTLHANDYDQGTLWLCSHRCAISFSEALVAQPSLRDLTVSGLAGISPQVLSLPSGLAHLTLDHTFVLSDDQDELDFGALRWTSLQSLTLLHTVFDTTARTLFFSRHIETLQSVEMTVSSLDDPSDLYAVVQACGSSVKTLEIKLVGIAAATLFALDEVDLSALTSLERLTLTFTRWPDVDIVKAFLKSISEISPLAKMVIKAGNESVKDDWNGAAGFELAIERIIADRVQPTNLFIMLTA